MKWFGIALGVIALLGVVVWAVRDVRQQEEQEPFAQVVILEDDAGTSPDVGARVVQVLPSALDEPIQAPGSNGAALASVDADDDVGQHNVQGEFKRGVEEARVARELRALERIDAFVTRAGVSKTAAQEFTSVMLEEDTRIREARAAADPRTRKRAVFQIRRETDARAKALLTDQQFEAYRQMRRDEAKLLGAGRLGRFRRDEIER